MKTLILIDGHSLAYRMYFALERTGMKTSDGSPTWAVYGFFNALFSLLKKIKPDAMAVSFDVGRITFRNELYTQYKAHRESMPEDMRAQMGFIREGVERLGIPVYEKPGFEADDVIGTLAIKAAKEGFWVQILTGDQDAFQLVDDGPSEAETVLNRGKIEVLIPSRGFGGRSSGEDLKTYNRQAVFEKWGIYPEQVIDFKGLKGDTSDNIPGVPGIGDKTAVKLLTEHLTLEKVYERLQELPPNKIRERLEINREQAFLSQKLATIDCEVPLEVDWEHSHLAIPDVEALHTFLTRMEFKNFLKQVPVLLASFSPFKDQAAGEKGISSKEEGSKGFESNTILEIEIESSTASSVGESATVHSLFEKIPIKIEHTLVTTLEQLEGLIGLIREYGVFAVDLETTSLDVHQAKLAGIAISVSDRFESFQRPVENCFHLQHTTQSLIALRFKSNQDKLNPDEKPPIQNFYIPIRQAGLETNLTEADILAALAPLLGDTNIIKLVHNAKYERNIFRHHGIQLQGLIFDTMIASYIQNPDRRHGLKSLSEEILGQPMNEIETLIGSGKKAIVFSEVPVEAAAAYAAHDTYATLSLADYFLSTLDEAGWSLFYEVEIPLVEVLADMEWMGVSLDTVYLKGLSEELAHRLQGLENRIYGLAGQNFNLNSPKQVAEILFDKMGIVPSRKTKGKTAYSTDVKVLELLANEHEVVRELLEYRQLFKLKSTYIDALPTLVNPETHRLHTSYNQTVTATGRLSSSNPNLQNIPIRSELGRLIRQAFIPEKRPNWSLLSADYSQIELRLLAHFSEDPPLIEAFQRGEDIHTATASLVFGIPIEKITKQQRYQAKTVNFGIIYGQSPYGLSQQLKIPQSEANQLIQLYFSRYSKVRQCIEGIKEQARNTGRVSTLAGRHRDFSRDLQSSNRSVREFAERAAFNMPLQGSAADLIKMAMIRLYHRLREAQIGGNKMRSKMILQVHDEVVLEVPNDELDEVEVLVREAMSLDQPLRVPLVIDFARGPTWMEEDGYAETKNPEENNISPEPEYRPAGSL